MAGKREFKKLKYGCEIWGFIKADNIETIVRALQVANESCQARDSTKQEDVDTCEGVEISGTGDEARRSSCENNAECVYVAR